MDRVQREAEARVLQPVEDEDRDDHNREREEVIGAGVRRDVEHTEDGERNFRRGNVHNATRPTEGVAEAVPGESDRLARGERADQEVEALHPEQREGQQQREEAGERRRQRRREPDR